MHFSSEQLDTFRQSGYLVVPGLATADQLGAIRAQAEQALGLEPRPLELESDVGYPGAPQDQRDEGGNTPRRLLQAFARGGAFQAWARSPAVVGRVAELLESPRVMLCQSHHNCLMTKFPRYSSDTLWHRDTRYWSFEPPFLVNAWLALGREVPENGGMTIIPGSHRWDLQPDQVDQAQFLRMNHPANAAALEAAVQADLDPGDVLFFNARVFHAASRNSSDRVKLSLVFSYYGGGTRPLPGTKSASQPPVQLTP